MDATEAARFEVTGQVQGVGYRFFVLQHAQALRLQGWVRNRADASVEVAAWGPPEPLRQLEQWLWSGPPGARVLQVRRVAGQPPGRRPSGFQIVHE